MIIIGLHMLKHSGCLAMNMIVILYLKSLSTYMFGSHFSHVSTSMVVEHRYNSGLKEFKEIPTKSFSISVDALTMKNDYWTSKKSKLSSEIFR